MSKEKIVVGISQGDVNGIGYEVIIKSLMDTRMLEMCTPVVFGSPKVAAYHRKALNINNFSFNSVKSSKDVNHRRANIVNVMDDNVRVELGRSTEVGGDGSYVSLENSIKELKDGNIDVLVTAPINKDNIQSDKFEFPGHTEYLAQQFDVAEVLMLMVSDVMRVGVVTGHVPINKVPELITEENILKKLRILNKSLIEDFGIRKPRIAVLGLNPHAGDNGVIGMEEQETIIPTIEKAKEEGIVAIGPFPADGFFGSDSFKKYDGVLAMYHDQGLIPFKAMEFQSGVNYTAGLPVIRTSPAHGTAYEIAGKNKANPESFRSALYLALDIYKNRKMYKELNKNPLPKYEVPQ